MLAAGAAANMPMTASGVNATGCSPTSTSTPANAKAMPSHFSAPRRCLNQSHAISARSTPGSSVGNRAVASRDVLRGGCRR